MKKIIVLALAAMMLMGCKKEESEPIEMKDEVVTEAMEDTVEKESRYAHEELDAYSEVLAEHLKDTKDGFSATLINIDDDDYYELAMFDGDAKADGAYLYTYKDGEAIDMATDGCPFYGSYGQMNYVPNSGYFSYDYDGAGGDGRGDLQIVDSINLYWETEDYNEDNPKTYYFNDQVITEEEYNSYYQAIFE